MLSIVMIIIIIHFRLAIMSIREKGSSLNFKRKEREKRKTTGMN